MRPARRRMLLAAAALAAAPLARAQKPSRTASLGILSFASEPTPEERANSPFLAKLKSLGWVEGRNLRIERAFAAGRTERLPQLAAGLVDKKVDVIWAVSLPAAIAAARATRGIPIVFARLSWPVELGLAESLARPGRNVTGIATIADRTAFAKPLEYLREIVPGLKRVTIINPHRGLYKTVSGGEFSPIEDPGLKEIMGGLGLDFQRRYVASVPDIDAALAAALQSRADGLFVSTSPLLLGQTRRIVEFALRHRLPSTFIESPFVEAGGLLSYGSSVLGTILESLEYVDAVLRGADPGELPIRLPTKMELAINLGTAKALSLTVPQSLLLRADKLLE
ncbi:MAG TPA: ABC transporter substrate-binding protein [Burkholderiales bacterium]|nr:ABC transporter substrate-binding protein [Burkholderiales bacterium]